MRYLVEGADRQTGRAGELAVEAASEDEAIISANQRGLLVASVRPMATPPPLPVQTIPYASAYVPKPARRVGPIDRWCLGLSVILFVAACLLPAMEMKKPNGATEQVPGFLLLLIGFMGLIVLQFAWLANLLLLAGAITLCVGARRPAAICGRLAVLLSLQTLMLLGSQMPSDAPSSQWETWHRPCIGFYLWVASMVCLTVPQFCSWRRARREHAAT